MTRIDPIIARKTWRTVEPIHGMIYFAPEAAARYEALGLSGAMGYFASRSAAMGPVGPEVVIATFYNFNPRLVRSAIPDAWRVAPPEAILEARLRAADEALTRMLGSAVGSPEMTKAAALARGAAETAAERPEGRTLFAAHAALPWPTPAHLTLWHAQSLLREFRGDGHLAALLEAQLDPVEALVAHAASGEVPADVLRLTRDWDDDDWTAGVERLRGRGWLEDGDTLALSSRGRAGRDRVEERTDVMASAPYAALGEEACAELRGLARPFSRAVVDAGLTNPFTDRAGR